VDKEIGTVASAGIWMQPGDGICMKRTTTNIKTLQAKSHPAFPSSRRTRPPENPDAKLAEMMHATGIEHMSRLTPRHR
jgi:hypothetical protein